MSDQLKRYDMEKPKALALLSGGLDSTLAVKLILKQGINVEAVNFVTPFCLCNQCSINRFAEDLKIKVHRIFLGQEFLDIIVNPPHGYGRHMNPCIDCRILMFKEAKKLAEKIGADFIVTGEVLNERPFSQRKEAMLQIERQSGLEGKILRPLSAKFLPISEPEKNELISREQLLAIRGRRRLPQMKLARKLSIKDYPCPSGGCLLTDPRFAERLREHLYHERRLTLEDVALLKVGRHFRVDNGKIIVGRNENENNRLMMIAKSQKLSWLEAVDYKGPITLIIGESKPSLLEKAATLTARYSDAPKENLIRVACRGDKEQVVEACAITDETLENMRI